MAISYCRSIIRPILIIFLWTTITVTGTFAQIPGFTKGIEEAVQEYATQNKCKILVQVEDPEGKSYDIGYNGRLQIPVNEFSGEYIEIGSCTKMFTASSILQLIEDGKLKLTDKLTDIFPDEPNLRGMLVIDNVDYIDSVTVKNLLNHTSGLQDYMRDIDSTAIAVYGDSSLRFTPWDLVALAKNLNADFIPGSQFRYSNTNYILLGLMIEKLSGMKYTDYVQKNILQPLGMNNTFLPSSFSLPGRKDVHYSQKIIVMPATLAWSAGEIVSTPADMNKFIRGWYSGKLFSYKMCSEVRSMYFDNAPSPYEFGLGVIKGPKNCFGHAGQTFGYQAYIGHTTNDYSFAIGIDDASVSVFILEGIVANLLLAEEK